MRSACRSSRTAPTSLTRDWFSSPARSPNLTASRISLERMRKIRIFQRSGYLSLNLADGTGEFLRLKGELPALGGASGASWAAGALDLSTIVERIPLQGDGSEPLRRELESFRDAALGISPPVVSGEGGRAALAVTLAIQERIQSTVGGSSGLTGGSAKPAG